MIGIWNEIETSYRLDSVALVTVEKPCSNRNIGQDAAAVTYAERCASSQAVNDRFAIDSNGKRR